MIRDAAHRILSDTSPCHLSRAFSQVSALSSSASNCCGPRARSVFDSTYSLGCTALHCALRCRGASAFACPCVVAHRSSPLVNDWMEKLPRDTRVCHHTGEERRHPAEILGCPDMRWRPRTVQRLSSCQCGVQQPSACSLPPGRPTSCSPSPFSTQSVCLSGRLLPIPASASAKLLH